jgi:hypothetical protein
MTSNIEHIRDETPTKIMWVDHPGVSDVSEARRCLYLTRITNIEQFDDDILNKIMCFLDHDVQFPEYCSYTMRVFKRRVSLVRKR